MAAQLLLEKGAKVESKDKYGQTPLYWAVGNGHKAVVKLLLEKGVELESKEEHGWMPLLGAATNGHETVVKLLLEKGANSDVKNLDANGSASHPIHLHPPNRSWIST